MQIVGTISSEAEGQEIIFIQKVVEAGIRAGQLGIESILSKEV